MSNTEIHLIACHAASADHFATYTEALNQHGYAVHIKAIGPALKKFQERGQAVHSAYSLSNLQPDEEDHLAKTIAKTCATASLVITDVGHAFAIKIQKALATHAPKIPRLAYYDNPENFVPGGYSSTAAQVMEASGGVLFANATLAEDKVYSVLGREIDFSHQKRFGIGYYPVSASEKLALKRLTERELARASFFKKNKIKDYGQKIWVYFGGNNEVYFSKAFPAFLSILVQASEQAELKDVIFVVQPHPGAKEKNQDGQQLAAYLEKYKGKIPLPTLILSDSSSDNAQIIADAAFYYQTSMAPQFVLAGIPTVQVGHETYPDMLVRNQLATSVTNASEFMQIIPRLENKPEQVPHDPIFTSLGIRKDWSEVFHQAIQKIISSKN